MSPGLETRIVRKSIAERIIELLEAQEDLDGGWVGPAAATMGALGLTSEDLAAEIGCSVVALRRVLRSLIEDGVILARRAEMGHGWYYALSDRRTEAFVRNRMGGVS